MKNLKYTMAAAAFLFAALGTQVSAQDGSGGAIIKKNKDKVEQEVDKVKADAKDREEKIKREKEKIKNQTGGIKTPNPSLSTQTDDSKLSKEERVKKYGGVKVDPKLQQQRDAIMKEYEVAAAKASSPEEKQKLRMEAKRKIAALETGDSKKDVDAKIEEETSKGGAIVKDNVKNTTDRVKSETGKVTRDVKTNKETSTGVITKKARIVKMDEVKTKLANKKSNLVAKQSLVKNGKARIAKATTKLDADIAAGKLNDDQIKQKRAAIARVQATVDRLEASLNEGKEVYNAKETVLSDMYKN